MLSIQKTRSCCTINELYGVRHIKTVGDCRTAIREVYEHGYPSSHIFFSDAGPGDTKTGGQRLAEFIEAQKIGTIIATKPRLHPRHGNKAQGWLWTPPRKLSDALKKCGVSHVWDSTVEVAAINGWGR